ncbi:putative membrane protein [Rhodospirillales bacterium URHD0017]|nr:putative membrane protein [Rhodospirillales bacterium URHD0017]
MESIVGGNSPQRIRIRLTMKSRGPAVSLLGLVAVLAVPALGQTTVPGTGGVPTTQQGSLSDKSAAVLRVMASANLFEIESSRLALARSQSAAVKEFADRMVGDHARAANRTRQVLAEMGASPTATMLEPDDQQKLDALKAIANQEFDRAYIDGQYTAHVEAIALVRDYARTGDNERLKALAAEALPLLQSHLDHVTRLRDGAKPR